MPNKIYVLRIFDGRGNETIKEYAVATLDEVKVLETRVKKLFEEKDIDLLVDYREIYSTSSDDVLAFALALNEAMYLI